MKVRKLNDKGKQLFADYLVEAQKNPSAHVPTEILDAPDTSLPLSGAGEVDGSKFTTRLEAAQYLQRSLAGVDRAELDHSPGVWNWLALFYFDELCPPDAGGRREVKEKSRYILPPIDDEQHWRHYYRHLLAGPYSLFVKQGNSARTLLAGPVDKPGDYNEQIASRIDFVANVGMMQAIDILYFDERTRKPKRGGQTRTKPGTLRRFIDVIQQFDRTFDLYSMTGRQIVELLPGEFERFRNAS